MTWTTRHARCLYALALVMTATVALWTPQAGVSPVLALLGGGCLGRLLAVWLPPSDDPRPEGRPKVKESLRTYGVRRRKGAAAIVRLTPRQGHRHMLVRLVADPDGYALLRPATRRELTRYHLARVVRTLHVAAGQVWSKMIDLLGPEAPAYRARCGGHWELWLCETPPGQMEIWFQRERCSRDLPDVMGGRPLPVCRGVPTCEDHGPIQTTYPPI